ncbi:hypothetical protein PGT21_027474 [Puccinia graminis f. sp. tritici]|uniref:CxC1-like cysteine cluster associated with KDZ transposases domain-containing protein n=1 Tax=Puccinia graminis f. sp. tritici TaxID=56615 RepID=A0A5B0QJG1_PUCGR|nr:hypothetical protein PGT21_027474 [Puccinia graminis f. sp. tritici]
MARKAQATPFKHETAKEKKKRERLSARHSKSRVLINALRKGNYQPPRIESEAQSSQSAWTNNDFPLENDHEANDEWQDVTDPGEYNPAGLQQAWGSIPWDVPAPTQNPIPSRYPIFDPEISRIIREHDRNAVHNTREDNWKQVMSKLFSAYLWLKDKTVNWTAPCSFDEFTTRFCKCQPSSPHVHQFIDLVDLVGQQRVKLKFCFCMPRSVQLLTIGFLPSSPVKPTAGFSMRLLAYHNYAWHNSNVRLKPFIKTQRIFSEERSEVLWNHSKTAGPDLRQCFSSTVLVYRQLLDQTTDLLQQTVCLTDNEKLASGTCPACFGSSSKTGLHQLTSVDNRLIVLLDGNFQHRHQKLAGRAAVPLVTPDIFVQPSDLDEVKEYIATQERMHKIPKKADKCADSHKAGNDSRNETTWKGCDDTGVMGSCCRHDSVIFLANIHGTGENRALPLAILKRILAIVGPERPVGVLYDLGCSLDKFVNLRDIFAEDRHRIKFGTSVFHSYAHEWSCQIKYNPRYQKGWGLSDGESLERLWSSLSAQISPLRYASRNNRLGALSHRCKYRNQQSIRKLAGWLRSKFDQALVRRDAEKDVITQLLQMRNPNGNGNQNYTIEFFRAQWDDQVRVGLTQEDFDEAGKQKLAEFYENEEVLQSLSDRLLFGRWPGNLGEVNQMFETIEKKDREQRQLAASLGNSYHQLREARTSETAMLLLLWKAKSELYAHAVEARAERQPLLQAESGNIAGTRLKEKILAGIKRRKVPVENAIKNFNDRRREYLSKYAPERLSLPENHDLSSDELLTIDLDDPLWNDGHFYHARAPWALDPYVRKGIKSVLFLDRVEEEIELLTQELDRSITWAHGYRTKVQATIGKIEVEMLEPTDPNNEFAHILPNFPMKSKLRLLHSELKQHLHNHEKLMVSWMLDVDTLWKKTRSEHTKATHPWFDVIHSIKDRLTRDDMGGIDDALENLTFQDVEQRAERTEEEERQADIQGDQDGEEEIERPNEAAE